MNRLSASLPLVGRTRELDILEKALQDDSAVGRVVFVTGEGGVGKSRVAAEVARRARESGWSVAHGRAYPMDTGIPYALFSDAFLPILRELGPEAITVLTRGGEDELRHIFPGLVAGADVRGTDSSGIPDEFRTRLLWTFSQFLGAFADRAPVLLVLEDLHWADESSLHLLHFVVRQVGDRPVMILATFNDAERERSPQLVKLDRSLVGARLARKLRLNPLSRDEVTELVCRTFEVEVGQIREFSALLFGWTRGNPFFVEEVLKSLVASGKLTSRQGAWVGWNADDFGLPNSIRDAVLGRLDSFSPSSRRVAEICAVVRGPASYGIVAQVSGLPEAELLTALDELATHRVLFEQQSALGVVFDFVHPLVRETLYVELGLPRARIMHGTIAVAMERYWGQAAMDHADELAYHFARSDAGELTDKALLYVAEAGRRALARHADREALNYLQAACDIVGPHRQDGREEIREGLLRDLGRVLVRLGEYVRATEVWGEALGHIQPGAPGRASMLRDIGLAHFWNGRYRDALSYYDEGLRAAFESGSEFDAVRLRLARSLCLQELGRGVEALRDAEAALPLAELLGDHRLLARAHRALGLLYTWTGPPDRARAHGTTAVRLAQEGGDLGAEFWARWGLTVLAGLRGDQRSMAEGIVECGRMASNLHSPVLQLWVAELSIEGSYASGRWDEGVMTGEHSIVLARALNQRTLLPRLLVWTSLLHIGQGDFPKARALLDEAVELSGIEGSGDQGADGVDVHLVVPTYIGLAHYQVAMGNYRKAIGYAEQGLHIAEGTGYTLWSLHRLLPILAEAYLWAEDSERAAEVGERMREHACALDHKLGLAWADACSAMVRWKQGDPQGGAVLMRSAAEALEEIPMVPYAARVRRQLAGRLAEIGDIRGSLEELRRVHDIFIRLGAELELEKARDQFREVGHRPPPMVPESTFLGLTEREAQIARLVAERKSNKAIGKELDISPRTVGTHLSNIFPKLGVSSRSELGDLVREKGLLTQAG